MITEKQIVLAPVGNVRVHQHTLDNLKSILEEVAVGKALENPPIMVVLCSDGMVVVGAVEVNGEIQERVTLAKVEQADMAIQRLYEGLKEDCDFWSLKARAEVVGESIVLVGKLVADGFKAAVNKNFPLPRLLLEPSYPLLSDYDYEDEQTELGDDNGQS